MPLPWLEKTRSMRFPAMLLVAFAAATLMAMVAHMQPAIRAQAQDKAHPSDNFAESVVNALPPEIDPETTPEAPVNGQIFSNAFQDDAPDYLLRGFGGGSYADTTGKNSMGGLYGLSLIVPIAGTLSAGASGMINHYDGGTQLGGTIGFNLAGIESGNPLERFGGSFAIDQYTDSMFDYAYAVQGRYALSYRLSRHASLAVEYTDPLHGEDVDAVQVVPTAAAGTVAYRPVEMIQGKITYATSVDQYLQLGFGYIDDYESFTYSAAAAYPLAERLAATFNASYDEKIGLWTGFAGISITLSPKRNNSWSTAARGGRDVVRGDSFGGNDQSWDLSSASISGTVDEPLSDLQQAISQQIGDEAIRAAWRSGSSANSSVKPCNCPDGFYAAKGICVDSLDPSFTLPCGSTF